jgi:hypothetical protein
VAAVVPTVVIVEADAALVAEALVVVADVFCAVAVEAVVFFVDVPAVTGIFVVPDELAAAVFLVNSVSPKLSAGS